MSHRPNWILPVIVFSQFTGTALWFAGNAVLSDLQLQWGIPATALGWMTSSVQLGFIAGTLVFAYFAISDRYSPRSIFLLSSLLGAFSNISIYLFAEGLTTLMLFRVLTGFFLAGIYPVGMKIAAGWYKAGLGKALGFLVGALVIGTAFPHLIRGLGKNLPWQGVMLTVSLLAALGGVLMFSLVPDGPYMKKGARFDSLALPKIFGSKDFRSAAFGYFGHMWELYSLWTFVPFILAYYLKLNPIVQLDTSVWSFIIIGVGGIGCIGGGLLSLKRGSEKVAFITLSISGICCLISPLLFEMPQTVFLTILILWGLTVVADSPQFSTLTAKTAPPELVGTGLTIVNSIGFALTIPSIQLLNYLAPRIEPAYLFLFLIPGPVFGLLSLLYLLKKPKKY